MKRSVQRMLGPWLVLTFLSVVTAGGPHLYEPDGTLTEYVKSVTNAQIYAPRDARAQKVYFPNPAESLVYPGEGALRHFFDLHAEDFADASAARRAFAFFTPRFQELVRSGGYLDLQIEAVAPLLFQESTPTDSLGQQLRGNFVLDAKSTLRLVNGKTSGPDELVDAWACTLLAPMTPTDVASTDDCMRYGWAQRPKLPFDWFASVVGQSVKDQRTTVVHALRVAVDHQADALLHAVDAVLREREDLFRSAVDSKTAIDAFEKELDRWFGADEQSEVFAAAEPEDRTAVATILTTTLVRESFPKGEGDKAKTSSVTAVRRAVRLAAAESLDFQSEATKLAETAVFKDGLSDAEKRYQAATKLLALVRKEASSDTKLLALQDALSAISDARLAPRFNSDQAYARARPQLEKFRLAMAAGASYSDAKKAAFESDEFGSLLNVISGLNDHLTAFANDLVAEFGVSISSAVNEDTLVSADYEYWWLTFYPKALPIKSHDWKGTSIVQVDFPPAALPESQFQRWLLDYYTDPKNRMLNAIDEQLELMKYDVGADTALASFLLGQLRAELLKNIPSIQALNEVKSKSLRDALEVSYADLCKEQEFYDGTSTFATASNLNKQVIRLGNLPDAGESTARGTLKRDSVLLTRLYYHPFVQLRNEVPDCAKLKSPSARMTLEHPLAWYEQELLIFAELLRWGGLPKNINFDFGTVNWARVCPAPKIDRQDLDRCELTCDFSVNAQHLFLPHSDEADGALLHPEFHRHLLGKFSDENRQAHSLHRYFLAIRALSRTTLYERTSSRIFYLLENQFGSLNARLEQLLPADESAKCDAGCEPNATSPRCLIVNELSRMQKALESDGNFFYPGPVILPDLKRSWSEDERIQSMMLLTEALLTRGKGTRSSGLRPTPTSMLVSDWLESVWKGLLGDTSAAGSVNSLILSDSGATLHASVLDHLSPVERVRITSELLDRQLAGLWKGLEYICRIDRAVPYRSLATKKAYDDFISVGKPHVQRHIEVMSMLPSSRDDVVAESISQKGALLKLALAGRGTATAGDVKSADRSRSDSSTSNSSKDTSKSDDSTGDKSSSAMTQLENFARRFDSILAYKVGAGASVDTSVRATLSHAYAYSKSKEYLDAVITSAGETDSFAKWLIRAGSKQTADAKNNAYPNGSIPFCLLVKIPRRAKLVDWDGSEYILFNSAYTLQRGGTFLTTRYPFLYDVDAKHAAVEQDKTLNALGGSIRLDPTDRISYDEIRKRLADESDFVAAARAAQRGTIDDLMGTVKDDAELTKATKDLIPVPQPPSSAPSDQKPQETKPEEAPKSPPDAPAP